MSYPPNDPCPCGSGGKYKKCCRPLHRGEAANDPQMLMRSRYCAYAVGDADYIIRTTHPDNDDFTSDAAAWRASIATFCQTTRFLGLKIIASSWDATSGEVTFHAYLDGGTMREKSRFLFLDGRWLYEGGEFLDPPLRRGDAASG